MDTNLPHNIEERLRNIEAHLGIGSVDEETGEYTVAQHDAPVADETVEETPQKSVAELEAELEAAKAREAGQEE